ncbi:MULTISPECIES: sugar ABC transporter ATP-binding protein [unclassified Paenibacillus]|uniref:sugar ABC transporter ATP-binding protein n=1 Tax=unclassified Paenibacillus TaxID=185978 RepID=UPI00278B264B|nr:MULTISPECIES: sugar ABC transporter ATP-binding protein [unclassified Paenibacillus]MDQ0900650.1 ribose transport system ATP-binding protein [Paenibacillus sp. V4I7]MDQ0920842.1 ribose transport system ATP-binding protein [Paenibacillus sp. V4I5]
MENFLQMKGITKRFNDNVVLNQIDFSADAGQVHALIGENGAGKSTLMKVLAGLFQPDEGSIYIDGELVSIPNPKEAQELGIAMIYQEIRLFQDLDIAENVFIRREPIKKWNRLIDWDKAYRETRKYLDDFGLNINARTPVKSLSSGQQKFVEIIKALSHKAKIIIMDEPTAALTEQEIETLFKVIRDLKKLGVAIIYISHRIEEIIQIADQVTVIRDGESVQTCSVNDMELNDLVKVMVGKELADRFPKLKVKLGKEVLRLENMSYYGRIRNINLDVKRGEIIGLTGLSGSGRRTLAKVLFGINGPFEGSMVLQGKSYTSMTPHKAKKNGLCYMTGINTEEGLLNNAPIGENITLTNLERISSFGFLNTEKERRFAQDMIERLDIETDEEENVNNLSGGKQKKVIFAKWLFANAKVMIIEEPTAGIDIGSKIDIYNMMNELVLSGASIIMISSDLSEIMGMSDRIAVMYNGEIRNVFQREEATQEKILYYASGGK